MWPIRFVDKFVCLTILGILTPFLTALREDNIFVARMQDCSFILELLFRVCVLNDDASQVFTCFFDKVTNGY